MTYQVWIIEDRKAQLRHAQNTVARVADELGVAVSIWSSTRIAWPQGAPGRSCGDLALPHLLVLDLADGEQSVGEPIYWKIREAERAPDFAGAARVMIVLWTGTTADLEPGSRFRATVDADLDTLMCVVKSREVLAEHVRTCLERLEEEGAGAAL